MGECSFKLVWSHGLLLFFPLSRVTDSALLLSLDGANLSALTMHCSRVYLRRDSLSLPSSGNITHSKWDSTHPPRWLVLVFRLRIIVFLQDPLVTVVRAWKDSSLQLTTDVGGRCTVYFLGRLVKSRFPLLSFTKQNSVQFMGFNDLVLRREKMSSPLSHVVSLQSRGCIYVKSKN